MERIMKTKNKVPVGATPIPKYANWDEHREELRLEAIARREEVADRRNIVAPR